ncbi:restriction endonuclease subunit S [Methanomethylovorans sp.]|uniref:restriction endonuclease subunit S n=1 Tax=Methanomethylovorans sp. TaxID=2758717 RepID=UPI00345E2A7A
MGNLKDAILVLESGSREKGGALSSGILSLGAEHLKDNGKFNLDQDKLKYISENHFHNMKNGHIKLYDILVVKDGATTGKTCFVDYDFPFEQAAINEHIFLLRTKENLFPKYLFYYLYSEIGQRYILNDFRGATVGGISRNFIDMPIPLPPLEVQRQIADVLDRASALIEKRKVQIDKLDLLVKSQFIEMFGDPVTNPKGWKTFKLGNLSSLITKGASPKWQGFSYTDDSTQTLFVTSENVREGKLEFKEPKYIENSFNIKQNRSLLHQGDFLINIVGASIGRAAQYNLPLKANINQAVALVRLKENADINDDYLLLYLNLPKALRMYEEMQVSVARANLSLKNISDLEILKPPLLLQNQFADFVQQVETQRSLFQESLTKLELNYKSLMQKCFNGEIF